MQPLSKDQNVEEVKILLNSFTRKRDTVFRSALSIRLFIGINSFISLLPDSSYMNFGMPQIYPAVTTFSGVAAAIAYVFAKQSKMSERLKYLQSGIAMIHDSLEQMTGQDSITREKELILLRSKIDKSMAVLHDDLFIDPQKVQKIA